MRQTISSITSFILAWKYSVAGVCAVILVGGGIAWSMSGDGEIAGVADEKPSVRVARVADLMGGNSLSVIAEVTSVNEAKISAESGGRIVAVRARLGNFVSAGQVLAELENSSQRAAVLQAEGALDAAKASSVNTGVSLDSARASAVNTLLSAYATAENALRDDIEVLFVNPKTGTASFQVVNSNAQLKLELENKLSSIQDAVSRQRSLASSLSATADLEAELNATGAELRMLRSYLDTLITVLNSGLAGNGYTDTEIATALAGATAARTSVTSSLAAITSTQSSLETASNNAGNSGALSSSNASIKQAQGAYNAALAALEKTIIRSPISGTLNNFTIKLGDFVSPTQQVAVVSNNGALEAIAYVSEEDRTRVAVGQKVTIEGGIMATITRVAPALDPVTRRVEVRIGLPSDATKTLTNGQSIRVQLASGTAPKASGALAIPVTALRMQADRNTVFTVVDSRLVAKEITIGKLSGDYVQVTAGLTLDDEIVADVRGLKEGAEIVIQ